MHLHRRLLPRTGPARRAFLAAVGAGLAASGLAVLQARLLSRAVDAAFLGGAGAADLRPWLVGLVLAALARAAALAAGELSAQRLAGGTKALLRGQLAEKLLTLGPRFAHRERTGELVQTATGGVEALDAYLAQYLPQLVLALTAPLVVVGFAAAADPLSAVVLFVTLPLIPVFMYLIGSLAGERTRRHWVTLSRLNARLLDGIQGLATLKALGRASSYAEAMVEATERLRAATMGVLRVAFLSALVLELLATIGTALVAVQVGLRLVYGRIPFAEALFVLLLAPEFYRPLRSLGAAFHAGLPGAEAARRIFEVVDVRAPEGGAGAAPDAPITIQFQGVGFAYEPGPRALDGVSFHIDAGTTCALVGPSGGGKSTTAALVLGFLQPDAGAVRVNGRPLADVEPAAWRRRVAWVSQRPHVFHGSVRDNLLLASPEASEGALREAMRLAQAEGFVDELPAGWNTLVGEGGQRLSAGQAQRLALARAFLKDAPVLVLDEPTAHLDPEHDARLREAIARLRRGRTVLLVAHRLSSVFDAERIVMLSGGRVLETGTHRELLEAGGAYTRLVAADRSRP